MVISEHAASVPSGVPVTRTVPVFGTHPESGVSDRWDCRVTWLVGRGQVDISLDGVCGQYRNTEAETLFGGLAILRMDLEEQQWIMLVKGARRDVWRTDPELPQDRAQFHRIGEQPSDTVDVLAPEPDVSSVAQVLEQRLYHQEAAGTPPKSGLTWRSLNPNHPDA